MTNEELSFFFNPLLWNNTTFRYTWHHLNCVLSFLARPFYHLDFLAILSMNPCIQIITLALYFYFYFWLSKVWWQMYAVSVRSALMASSTLLSYTDKQLLRACLKKYRCLVKSFSLLIVDLM